ncbi:MAG: phosphatase PAP2 family protein [Bacteroidales bacterium]|nr:phosphatase PAP2 family protein [Candidatus Cryptobacteroides equifaecalis]
MKKLLLAFLVLVIMQPVNAQKIYQRDSSGCAFNAKQLIAPATLMTAGLSIHFAAHDSWDASVQRFFAQNGKGNEVVPFDDWLQYAPVVMDLGLGLLGAKAENPFLDRLIEGTLAYASLGIINGSAKYLFHTLRPNGNDYRSFPSGHTAFVFTGAELVRLEYGWGWGLAAYGMAGTVAYMRLYRNWHWLSDVIMAAGVGILCADIGRWLLDPTRNLLGLNKVRWNLSVAPTIDPLSGTLCTQFALNF